MKKSSRSLLVLATLLGVGTGPAFGATFNYSYLFADELHITGSFEGTQNGQYVENVSNLSLFFNGAAAPGSIYASAYDEATFSYLPGPVIWFAAELNNFFFTNSDYAGWDLTGDTFFGLSNGTAAAQSFTLGFSGSYDQPIVQGSWSLSEATSVPDSGATGLMLGTALVGLCWWRRRAWN